MDYKGSAKAGLPDSNRTISSEHGHCFWRQGQSEEEQGSNWSRKWPGMDPEYRLLIGERSNRGLENCFQGTELKPAPSRTHFSNPKVGLYDGTVLASGISAYFVYSWSNRHRELCCTTRPIISTVVSYGFGFARLMCQGRNNNGNKTLQPILNFRMDYITDWQTRDGKIKSSRCKQDVATA